ncbi:replicative DNA helicase [Helicobacter salomonis]|uniref:replicative DNA helicase n=1 Tax=Helicobacter salomonis TaxID=56878 RepID=UPI000CF1986C|nr:DnaB-like helicase C-terminal domain-containing protein [Helicobacter salomonis]
MSAFIWYERAVLRALLKQEIPPSALTQLEEADFTNPPTRALFIECVKLLNTCDIIDDRMALARLPRYQVEIKQVMQTPNNGKPEPLIKILKEASHRRALQEMGENVQKECNSFARPMDIQTHALQSLEKIARENTPLNFVHTAQQSKDNLLQEIDQYLNGELSIVRTGYSELDELVKGFKPGNLIILGAATSMGKTAFALNLSLQVLAKNRSDGVLFCSLEMTEQELQLRLVSLIEGVNADELADLSRLGPERLRKIHSALDLLQTYPFYTYSGSRDYRSVLSAINSVAKKGVRVVILDYLQLMEDMDDKSNFSNLHVKLSKFSAALKACALNNKIIIIALAQIKRAVQERDDRRPLLSDIKESGSIENDADIVLFLHREFKHARERIFAKAAKRFNKINDDGTPAYSRDDRNKWIQEALQKIEAELENDCQQCEIIVAKNRNGKLGTALTWFYPPLMRFTDDSLGRAIHLCPPNVPDIF